ncbi:MAG TPA: DUF1601 domain-containing protein, partial [Nitrosopumilaceae archaeon]|nr:DUF1601 domain-containing protein [Nitrosopumilaceae archaeon]
MPNTKKMRKKEGGQTDHSLLTQLGRIDRLLDNSNHHRNKFSYETASEALEALNSILYMQNFYPEYYYNFNEITCSRMTVQLANIYKGMPWEIKQELDQEVKKAINGLIQIIPKFVDVLDTQSTAKTLWAFAKLGILWKRLPFDVYEPLLEAVKRNTPKFNAQGTANTLWA